MLRHKFTLLVFVAVVSLITACSGITSPTRDGDTDTERCQVTQGSSTRCTIDSLPD